MRLKHSSLILLFSLLSACSTTEKTVSVKKTTQAPIEPVIEIPLDAETLYQNARLKRGLDKINQLQQARDLAFTEKNWPLLELICENLISIQHDDNVQNKLYIALSKFHQQRYAAALSILDQLKSKLTSPVHFYWHQYTTARIYAEQNLTFESMPYFFRASETAQEYDIDVSELNALLWLELTKLPAFTLEQLKTGSVNQQGWVNLALYTNLYLGDPVALHSAMNNWQRRYINHPASFALPAKMQNLMEVKPYEVSKLVVLLPASGKNKKIGTALMNGIVAASDIRSDTQLHFINSELSADDITEQLAEITPDFVIGPLFRQNISKLKEKNVLANYPTIFLNTSEQQRQSLEHYFFALSPDHEVTQSVHHFLAKGYQKPLLIVPDNNSGRRHVDYFLAQWEQYATTSPEVGYYANKEDMQKQIKLLLEVDKSKARINTIKSLFKTKIKSETRSRRDIDAIYLLGDPVQTRLLKPYFDVNVSTFVERIPLYASSKSHSLQVDKTDKRDLAGLYFTEMPWMLQRNHTQPELRAQFDKLWPSLGDLQQRLFAMGYDSVKLIQQIRQLSVLPGKTIQGLSGQLSVNTQGEVQRTLQWAQYRKKSVVPVDLIQTEPTPLFIQELSLAKG